MNTKTYLIVFFIALLGGFIGNVLSGYVITYPLIKAKEVRVYSQYGEIRIGNKRYYTKEYPFITFNSYPDTIPRVGIGVVDSSPFIGVADEAGKYYWHLPNKNSQHE